MSGVLRNTILLIRLLRSGPQSSADIAKATGLGWRSAYRMIDDLREMGAPIVESIGAAPARGVPPKCWTITALGLQDWLGRTDSAGRPHSPDGTNEAIALRVVGVMKDGTTITIGECPIDEVDSSCVEYVAKGKTRAVVWGYPITQDSTHDTNNSGDLF